MDGFGEVLGSKQRAMNRRCVQPRIAGQGFTASWTTSSIYVSGTLWLAPALALVSFGSANAAPLYQAISPPSCPSAVQFPYQFTSLELEQDYGCIESSTNPCPHYANTLLYLRHSAYNAWTDRMDLRVSYFNMFPADLGLDFLDSVGGMLTGDRAAGTWLQVLDGTGPGQIRVYSASGHGGTTHGFGFDTMNLCTTRTSPRSNDAVDLRDTIPFVGALLGKNDGITFAYPTYPGMHLGIALRGQGTNDFDIYVDCNTRPSYESPYSSCGTTSNEFIHMKECVGTAYITVRSSSGAGPF